MSAKTHESATHINLTKGKPKRSKVRPTPAAALADQSLAPREGLLTHAWIDRDLSWLQFNWRVLHEALDERTPLLERLKFLAIFTSNLDEFYMKRVGLLRGMVQVENGAGLAARSGSARDRLMQVRKTVLNQLEEQARCYQNLVPILASHGIILAHWSELTAAQREEASHFFDRNVSPALTPLGLDPAHPFPFVSNLSTNWGFILRNPDTEEYVPVRVKIPTLLPSWIALKADVASGERRFLRLEDLIRHSAECFAFCATPRSNWMRKKKVCGRP